MTRVSGETCERCLITESFFVFVFIAWWYRFRTVRYCSTVLLLMACLVHGWRSGVFFHLSLVDAGVVGLLFGCFKFGQCREQAVA